MKPSVRLIAGLSELFCLLKQDAYVTKNGTRLNDYLFRKSMPFFILKGDNASFDALPTTYYNRTYKYLDESLY